MQRKDKRKRKIQRKKDETKGKRWRKEGDREGGWEEGTKGKDNIGFFVYWHINLHGLFNANAIFVKEQ